MITGEGLGVGKHDASPILTRFVSGGCLFVCDVDVGVYQRRASLGGARPSHAGKRPCMRSTYAWASRHDACAQEMSFICYLYNAIISMLPALWVDHLQCGSPRETAPPSGIRSLPRKPRCPDQTMLERRTCIAASLYTHHGDSQGWYAITLIDDMSTLCKHHWAENTPRQSAMDLM